MSIIQLGENRIMHCRCPSSGVPGDLTEMGMRRCVIAILMRAALKAYEVSDKLVWVADSFEGLPDQAAEEFPIEAKVHRRPGDRKCR